MEDFPANSAKARVRSDGPPQEEPKKVEQVTSATAVRRKRRLGRQFKETFISGSARGAVEYMATDVIVPAIRDTLFDAIQGGIERLIYGDSRGIRRSGPPSGYPSPGPQVNYAGMSTNKPPTNRALSQRSRARHNFGEIIIQNRQEAEDVLDRLYDELSRYGSVTVAVLYELTGIQSSHTDHRWGWTSLRGARVRALTRTGGYLIDLPDPQPLDR
jgi:hypothetical protein